MANKIIAALLISAIALTLAGCSSTENSETPAPKFVGSSELMMSSKVHPTFTDFVLFDSYNTTIVIATVDSVHETYEGFFHEPEDEFDLPPTYIMTHYNVTVEQTLSGDVRDTLLLGLLGTPDCDLYTTKPPVGSRVLLIIGEGPPGIFYTIGFERSIFLINDDDTVYSLHDDPITAQFDGQPLSALVAEIERILDEGEFSEDFFYGYIEEFERERRESVERNRERRRQQKFPAH
jgi:hypothetical protein